MRLLGELRAANSELAGALCSCRAALKIRRTCSPGSRSLVGSERSLEHLQFGPHLDAQLHMPTNAFERGQELVFALVEHLGDLFSAPVDGAETQRDDRRDRRC